MRVVAVDPGYDRLGVAVLEHGDHGEPVLLFSDCIETDKTQPITERLYDLGERFMQLVQKYKPEAVAVETIFFNKNQKTAVAVAEARGIILFLALKNNCVVNEYGPQEVKVVIAMTTRLLKNTPTQALDDEYDAIAIGITHLAHCPKNYT
jgi:crossover junction endodeoxyribonuclease RuvC